MDRVSLFILSVIFLMPRTVLGQGVVNFSADESFVIFFLVPLVLPIAGIITYFVRRAYIKRHPGSKFILQSILLFIAIFTFLPPIMFAIAELLSRF